jgi:hypothetical protein
MVFVQGTRLLEGHSDRALVGSDLAGADLAGADRFTGTSVAENRPVDLHANVWVGARDRARLEHLCRYLFRPPLARDRLRLLADGRVRVELKRAWSDGTRHLLFEPVEFLEKLVALTPRPAINLVLYHRVIAPHARWRPEVVAYARAGSDEARDPSTPGISTGSRDLGERAGPPRDEGGADAPSLRSGCLALSALRRADAAHRHD